MSTTLTRAVPPQPLVDLACRGCVAPIVAEARPGSVRYPAARGRPARTPAATVPAQASIAAQSRWSPGRPPATNR